MASLFSIDTTTLTPTTITLLSLLLLIPLLYLYTALSSAQFPTLRSLRILLLIAHPDDEAMFLAPTVTRLTDSSLGNHLKILCLSVGNADGLGEVRRKELYKSAEVLGLKNGEKDVLIVDDAVNLPDSMTKRWDEKMVAELLVKAFAPGVIGAGGGKGSKGKGKGKAGTSTTGKSEKPEAGIDVIITFDKHGVSSHPNHIACHASALEFVNTLMSGRDGWACPVDVYTLTSVPIWRKYASVVDCLFTVLAVMGALIMSGARKGKAKAKGKAGRTKEAERERPSVLMFVSTPGEWWRGIQAMTRAHVSQMRWFRWGWIGLSRYMVINDLRRVSR